jgi:hypothetical protein
MRGTRAKAGLLYGGTRRGGVQGPLATVADLSWNPDSEGYELREASNLLGMSNDHLWRFLESPGRDDSPKLNEGLRVTEAPDGYYHDIRIHPDDIIKVVARVAKYRVDIGNAAPDYLGECRARCEMKGYEWPS